MMKCIALWLAVASAYDSRETMVPVPSRAVELNSTTGFEILMRSQSRSYREVAIHFTTQETESLCAIASAVAVLNAIAPAPVDPTYEPYAYWTQDTVTSDPCVLAINDPYHGSTRTQLAEMLRCFNIDVDNVGAPKTVAALRDVLTNALADDATSHVLVNFERKDLDSEAGGGHFSPIVAIDPVDDLVLMLDVARYKYPPLWFPLEDLWKSTLRVDSSSGESRGFLVLQAPTTSAMEK